MTSPETTHPAVAIDLDRAVREPGYRCRQQRTANEGAARTGPPHLDPEIVFDGTNGIAYQCEWNNTTNQLVTFGESALQEMCFMWMYYYPSHGFDFRTQ